MLLKIPAMIAAVIAAVSGIGGCATTGVDVTASNGEARDQFLAKLASMCGQRFEGACL